MRQDVSGPRRDKPRSTKNVSNLTPSMPISLAVTARLSLPALIPALIAVLSPVPGIPLASASVGGVRDAADGVPHLVRQLPLRSPADFREFRQEDQQPQLLVPGPDASLSPAPSASPSQPPTTVHLWSVREGVNDGTLTNVTVYRAERNAETALLTRLAPPPAQDRSVVLTQPEEVMLRERISKITSTLGYKPNPKTKDTCPHWVEFDSFYGKRFYCEGYDSDPALDFLSTLRTLIK